MQIKHVFCSILMITVFSLAFVMAEETSFVMDVYTPVENSFQSRANIIRYYNFEDQLPGEWPKQWLRLWGDSTKEAFAVSNLQSWSGKNSILLERQISTMYGISCKLPPVVLGSEYVLAFSFMVRGSGNSSVFSFEMRQGNQRGAELLHISFKNREIILLPGTRKRKGERLLAKYNEGVWYRVILRIPEKTEDGIQAKLFNLAEEGRTLREIGCAEVSCAKPIAQDVYFTLTTAPNHFSYQLYIDDLRVMSERK